MNNFSPLPASASNTRLSTPEAPAPIASPVLQRRRQKLRRLVTWVVGGAAGLMCVGLVCGAVRAHSRAVALTQASAEAAPAIASLPPSPPSAPVTAAAATPVTSAAPTGIATPTGAPAKPVRKPGIHAKSKHSTSKTTLAHH